jgi:glycosyltransferase involved in cell wall biosynthesis
MTGRTIRPLPMTITAFFPAYNESLNLAATVKAADEALRTFHDKYEIIIVNDGSTDSTAELLQDLCAAYPALRVVSHQTNLGYGSALRSGFAAAQNELVFFSDADLQFDLTEIRRLVDALPGHDAVLGYRAPRQDGRLRVLAGWGWSRLVSLLFGIRSRDIDCAFKLFTRTALERADAAHLISTGATASAELLLRLRQTGARTTEIPVTHFPRRLGTPTGLKLHVIGRAFRELKILYQIKNNYRGTS